MRLYLSGSNPYVHVDEHNTSVYSISFNNNDYYQQMIAYYKRYNKNPQQFPQYKDWEDVVLPEKDTENIPHLIDVNGTCLYKYSNNLLEEAYIQAVQPSIPTELYPIATRYIDSSGNYYIERPPFQVDIDYKIGGASSRTKRRVTDKKIWVPWTLFIFNPDNMGNARMLFSHKSLTHESDVYVTGYLPNLYSDGNICYSNSLNTIPDIDPNTKLSIAQVYALMINEYFAGSWNADLGNTWQSIYTYYYSLITKHYPDDAHLYPQMTRLFCPSNETIKSVFSPKSSVYKIFNSPQLANRTNHITYLDYMYFHEYILTMLTTFSLQDILALVEEVSGVYTNFIDPEHKYHSNLLSRIDNINQKNFYLTGDFAKLKEEISVNLSNSHYRSNVQRVVNNFSSFPVLHCIPSEYTSLQTKILIYNDQYFVDNYYLRVNMFQNYSAAILSELPPLKLFSLLDKIVQDINNGLPISDSMYCYDVKSDQVHVVPYSLETYKRIVTDYSNSTLDLSGYINDKV